MFKGRSIFGIITASFIIVTAAGMAKSAAADPAQDALGFIQDLSRQTISVITDEQLTAEQKVEKFRAIFAKGFDINTLSRVVLGRHWRRADSTQRAEYILAFENYVIETYARRLADVKTLDVEIKGTRVLNEKDVLVGSRFVRPDNQQPIRVEWRVRQKNAEFKIVDLVVEGVSMAVTQRAEFGSLIRNNGGSLDVLLKVLRNKTIS